MSTISTSEEPGARLQESLTSWAMHLAPAQIQDSRYQAAFEAIDPATIEYMEGRKAGKPQDQNHEWQLTELWMEASRALSPIDIRAHIFRRHQADLVSPSGKHPTQMVRAVARLHRHGAKPEPRDEALQRAPSHPTPQNN